MIHKKTYEHLYRVIDIAVEQLLEEGCCHIANCRKRSFLSLGRYIFSHIDMTSTENEYSFVVYFDGMNEDEISSIKGVGTLSRIVLLRAKKVAKEYLKEVGHAY